MRVCLHIDRATGYVAGAWWELPDELLDCEYAEPLSMLALEGVEWMARRPADMSWHRYWQRLADRVSPLEWFEVAEVDDESYGYDLLYRLSTCHPSSPDESVRQLLAQLETCGEVDSFGSENRTYRDGSRKVPGLTEEDLR